jgi:uncharacterized protein YacL
VDLGLVVYYLAVGIAIALFFAWLSGRPLSFRPVDVASGLVTVAALYVLQTLGLSFERGILMIVVASGLWYGWRRIRAHPA